MIDTYLYSDEESHGREPNERYTSFDYCYNHFHTFYKNNELSELTSPTNMEMSCLHLGHYLASWGMYRGSSILLQRSARHFRGVIETIASSDPRLWKIDVEHYNEEVYKALFDCKNEIEKSLRFKNGATDTLLTKIMLGVYCNIPAFDRNFKSSFHVAYVTERGLEKIRRFHEEHRSVLDSYEIHTLDFKDGKPTDIRYPKIKLIDMYGFIDGQ